MLLSTAALGLGSALLPLSPTAARGYTLSAIPSAPVRSYGPNGTHWPAHTPRTGHAVTLRVACNWAAIRSAIASVTAAQAARGVIILVGAGTLPADAARDMLSNVGSATWSRNVLITPEPGYGTVTMTGTARMRRVEGVTFARFIAHNIRMVDCTRTTWAHCRLNYGMRIYSSSGVVSGCDGYELVMPNSRVNPEDAFSYSAGPGSTLTNCLWEGCYTAPIFRPNGSNAHLDTFQMFGGGFYRGLTIRDSVFFGSNNCALQIGGSFPNDPRRGTNFLTIDHSIVMSQSMAMRTRFPMLSGGSGNGGQAINGGGEDGQLSAINGSYVLGSMHVTRWNRVQDSYTSHARAVTGNPARTGQWIYRSDLVNMTAAQLTSLAPVPTDTYLRRIWT